MKKRKATLVDLHYDILKEILICVATSSNGAKHFANAISVSKALQQFVEDVDVLRAVNFDNILVSGRWEWFQFRGGLTCRCARSGQRQAQFILAKVILVSTSQLLIAKTEPLDKEHDSSSKDKNLSEKASQASDFLRNFLPYQTYPNVVGHHFDIVKIFLSQAGCSEFIEMKPYINNYMSYFIVCMEHDSNHHTTLKHLVDSKLIEFERCYVIEKSFTSWMLKLPSSRTMCLTFARDCHRLGLKKERLGSIIAVVAQGREKVCDGYFTLVVAELDLKLKRLRVVKAILESLRWQNQALVAEECEELYYDYFIKVVAELDINIKEVRDAKVVLERLWSKVRSPLPVQDELTYDALLDVSLRGLEDLTLLVNVIERKKAKAVKMQEKRASIVLTFHQLLKERALHCN